MDSMQDKENIEENDIFEEESTDVESRVYEIGYLLVSDLKEEEVPTVYGDLKELVSSFGGQIISDEMPVAINLAYPMRKVIQNVNHNYDSAYFGWVKFFMDPEKVAELKRKLDFDSRIIRFLIIKTVKENTIASKRFVRDASRRKNNVLGKTDESKEEGATINKEEIDKEIEAMVAN